MNLPNLLTLSRIAALFIVVGLLMLPWVGAATVAFVLFVVASITDWLDGYIARKYNMISNFGKLMDALADKVLVMGMFVVLLAMDILAPWTVLFVLLMLSREFLITGLRLVAATRGRVLAAERAGKLKTVIQIVSISVYLFSYALTTDFACWGMRPEHAFIQFTDFVALATFIVATILTVTSGVSYLVRYADLLWQKSDL